MNHFDRALQGAALVLLMQLAQPALANDPALAQCRALADATARLACYDRIPLAATPRAPAAPAVPALPAPAAVAAPTGPAAAAVPAVPPVATAVPAAQPKPAAAPAPAADPAAGLGLPSRAEAAERLSSTIPGLFEGWGPRERIRLANGQLWEVVDGSRAAYRLQNPAVTVRRTVFGGFEMDIEGVNQRLRVRRVE
jgi:hypothetical protein